MTSPRRTSRASEGSTAETAPLVRRLLRNRLFVAAAVLAPLGLVAAAALAWPDDDTGPAASEASASEQGSDGSDTTVADDGRDVGAGSDGGARGPREVPGVSSEGAVGEPIAMFGFRVTVVEARLEDDPGGREQVVVVVTLENVSGEPQRYGYVGFSLATEQGPVLPPLPPSGDDALALGTLDPGEEVTGTLSFDAGAGTHTLVLDPGIDPSDPQRVAWTLEL